MAFGWLWALDKRGNAFRLAAENNGVGSTWRSAACSAPLCKLSATQGSCWALGTDSNVYLFVLSSDVILRTVESVYENQRWYVLGGFSSNLLPTDVNRWTSEDGTQAMPMETYSLPSCGWEWEDPWAQESSNFTDKEGWMYATNFNGNYERKSFPLAFVRRRRWIRARRYVATDRWVKISSPADLLDISVGGTEVPGQSEGFACVWALTDSGNLLFRTGVCRNLPEGSGWEVVSGPSGVELNHLSCSPSDGRLWAISWDGRLFARTGHFNKNYFGDGWMELDRPGRLLCLALGDCAVWSLTVDGKVWFLRLKFGEAADNVDNLTVQNWLEMEQSMLHLSTGRNDQTFGIGLNDGVIYFRTEVSSKTLSGCVWRPVICDVDSNVETDNDLVSFRPKYLPSQECLTKCSSECSDHCNDADQSVWDHDDSSCAASFVHDDHQLYDGSSNQSFIDQQKTCARISLTNGSIPSEELDRLTIHDDTIESGSESGNSQLTNKINKIWASIDVGGFWLSGANDAPPKHWFEPASNKSESIADYKKADWRRRILNDLRRWRTDCDKFVDYETPLERHSWVRTMSGFVWPGRSKGRCCDAVLVLTEYLRLSPSATGAEEDELAVIVSTKKREQTFRVPLSDVLCIVYEYDSAKCKHMLLVYARNLVGDSTFPLESPLVLLFRCEEDQRSFGRGLEDWLAKRSGRNFDSGNHANKEVWAVADNGSVYVSRVAGCCLLNQTVWRRLDGHFRAVESGARDVVWGLGYDGRLWVRCSANGDGLIQQDSRIETTYENQRWSGFFRDYFPLTRLGFGWSHAWSDRSGLYSTPKDSFRLPGSEWQWVGDWTVDFKGDCDDDGWQYAKTFSGPFSGKRRLNRSNVRRRQWQRMRRVRTTGFWLPVDANGESRRFLKMAVQRDHAQDYGSFQQYVFACTENGELLCRLGVDEANPAGLVWQHMPTDVRMVDVSLGKSNKLWAIGHNGRAYCCYAANAQDLLISGWVEISPPDGCHLTRITAGDHCVYSLDKNGRLYYRVGVTPCCPDGVCWLKLDCCIGKIVQISLSLKNELWAVVSTSDSSTVIARKYDIQGAGVLWNGNWWDAVDITGWSHVSAVSFESVFHFAPDSELFLNRQTLTMTPVLLQNSRTNR